MKKKNKNPNGIFSSRGERGRKNLDRIHVNQPAQGDAWHFQIAVMWGILMQKLCLCKETTPRFCQCTRKRGEFEKENYISIFFIRVCV